MIHGPYYASLNRYGMSLDDNGNLIMNRNARVGVGDDYTEIKSSGPVRYRGTALAWKDIIADLTGRKLNTNAGNVSYNWDENTIDFSSGGNITLPDDRVQLNQEINHEFKVGQGIVLQPHLHWFQSETTQFEVTLRYRLQRNGQAKTLAWTSVILTAAPENNVFTYISGTLNQVTGWPDIVIDCDISDTLQIQIGRTDALGGIMPVSFLDIHGVVDSSGSEETWLKTV